MIQIKYTIPSMQILYASMLLGTYKNRGKLIIINFPLCTGCILTRLMNRNGDAKAYHLRSMSSYHLQISTTCKRNRARAKASRARSISISGSLAAKRCSARSFARVARSTSI